MMLIRNWFVIVWNPVHAPQAFVLIQTATP